MSAAVQIVNGTFVEQGHVYRNAAGIEVPSVTGILDGVGLTDLGSVPGDTLERKRRLGDAVHYATAIMDRNKYFGGPELDWDTVHEDTVPFILAYENFCREMNFVPEEVETSGVHTVNGMEFGYTRDRVGRMKDVKYRVVLEIKCAYSEEVAWRVQLAAYELTVPKQKDEHIVRVVAQLKPDTNFRPYLYEQPRDRDVWMYALALTNFKINNGLPWRKDEGR